MQGAGARRQRRMRSIRHWLMPTRRAASPLGRPELSEDRLAAVFARHRMSADTRSQRRLAHQFRRERLAAVHAGHKRSGETLSLEKLARDFSGATVAGACARHQRCADSVSRVILARGFSRESLSRVILPRKKTSDRVAEDFLLRGKCRACEGGAGRCGEMGAVQATTAERLVFGSLRFLSIVTQSKDAARHQ
jgi:hypothetical protein